MTTALLLALLSFDRSLSVSSLVLSRPLSQCRRRCQSLRQRSQQLRCFGGGFSFEGGEATATAAVLNDDARDEIYRAGAPSTMIPLSRPPLLLLRSSAPIISREACSLLSRYFDHATNSYYACKMDKSQARLAEALLSDIHDVIDEVTDSPRHDGEMQVPRYVRYNSTVIDNNMLLDPKRFGNALLPDGLHVDTNNGKLFRHITAILYLTDNQDGFSMYRSHGVDGRRRMVDNAFFAGGGTTFPLAIPTGGIYRENLLGVATRLLECGIHHTKGDVDENETSDGRILEKAALDVFHCSNADAFRALDGQCNHLFSNAQPDGVRVMPEAGKLIYFHNVDDRGMPDPMTFHGGEELITILPSQLDNNLDETRIFAKAKSILVFFKEIPLQSFWDRGREGFAKEAEKSRLWTKEMYY